MTGVLSQEFVPVAVTRFYKIVREIGLGYKNVNYKDVWKLFVRQKSLKVERDCLCHFGYDADQVEK